MVRGSVINGEPESTEYLSLFVGLVIEIDEEGKMIDGQNPPRTIRVNVISPRQFPDTKILYPMCDFIKTPISIGEAAVFLFSDTSMTYGYWFNRLPAGVISKELAADYYTGLVGEEITDEALTNDPNPYGESKPEDNVATEDAKYFGRTDCFVAKADGKFEIGEGAVEPGILGDTFESYVQEQFATIKKALVDLQKCVVPMAGATNAIFMVPPASAIANVAGDQAETEKLSDKNNSSHKYLSKITTLK